MLIGIDGGGTKTALCLTKADGTVLNTVTGLGSNPADLGIPEAQLRLEAQLRQLLEPYAGLETPLTSMYAGIAGSANTETSKALHEFFVKLLPNTQFVDNGSDAFNALYGESDTGDGIALISGTGSSSFVLSEGEFHQVGGWGYLVDDAGSGFRVGADALRAAYRAYDGRGEKTMLMNMCLEKLETSFREAIPKIYAGGKRYIASFAYLAFEAFLNGDPIATDIIQNAANALRDHLTACLVWVKKRPAVCVVSGGLINNDVFFNMVQDALGEDRNNIIMQRPTVAPVYGALAKAARNASIPVTESFRENFIKGYR